MPIWDTRILAAAAALPLTPLLRVRSPLLWTSPFLQKIQSRFAGCTYAIPLYLPLED